MTPEEMKFDPEGVGQPCALTWPLLVEDVEEPRVLALPLKRRLGGFMVALPAYLGPSLAEDAASEQPLDMLGLSTIVSVPAVEEDEQGNELPVGLECSVLLLDADDGLSERMVPYDPVTDLDVVSFVPGSSQLVPEPEALQRAATDWVEGAASEKLGFYTAAEELPEDSAAPVVQAPKRQAMPKKRVTVSQLSEQVTALTGVLPGLVEQMKSLVERQNQLEKAAPVPQLEKAAPALLPAKAPVPVHQQPFPQAGAQAAGSLGILAKSLPAPSKLAPALAPPPLPAPSAAKPSPLATAADSASGDAKALRVLRLGELLETSVSGKGSAKRERLQQDLAAGSSTFFLQVCQEAHRRLHPALPVPTSMEDMRAQGRLSLVSYLERQGRYAQQRGSGLIMLTLATIGDCFLRGDTHAAMEHLGLALAATEQSCTDNGRGQAANTRLRAFSRFCDAGLREEVDLLSQRRKDAVQPSRATGETEEAGGDEAKPKKQRPRSSSSSAVHEGSRARFEAAGRGCRGRLLHILVMALNFLHQARCLSYLGGLVRTYGSEQVREATGEFTEPGLHNMNSTEKAFAGSPALLDLYRRLGNPSETLGVSACRCSGPVAIADVAAPYADRLYATDASERKGACVSAPLPEHLRRILWATADRKGAYARICSPAQALLRRADPMFEEKAEVTQVAPERPLAFLFDFFGIGSWAGQVLSEVRDRGWVVGPLIASTVSPHFCLSLPRLLDWVFYLIDEDRVRAIYIAIPFEASLTSLRHSLAVLLKARAADVAFVAEAPFFLRGRAQVLWEGARKIRGIEECSVVTLLPSQKNVSLLVSEVCSTKPCVLEPTDQVWRWKGQVHILILEASALARLFTDLALKQGPLRFVNLCDSHVARAAVSKGRSASPGLRHATRRASAVALAAGLYHGGMYCPTRLIPADNPTRDRPFEPPVLSLGPDFWNEDRLLLDASRPRLRRWAANWARLVFALTPSAADVLLQPDWAAKLPVDFFPRFWISVGRPVAAMEAARARKTETQRSGFFNAVGPGLASWLWPDMTSSPTTTTASLGYLFRVAETGLLSISLLWGWFDVAGILAICWGGLARVGEAMAAKRRDLVLPDDVGAECGADGSMILMAVMEPKTRFKAARHQCVKVDQPQLVKLIRTAFYHLKADEKLWPRSGATLRARFQKLLAALGIPTNAVANVRDFDLASLRAGGATWLMGSSESPDLVRRRGRWVTLRVMEIYIQEVAAMMFLPRLEPELRQHIFSWANVFDEALDYVAWCQALSILPKAWLFLLQQGVLHA
ncbi:mok12, partial [Symbiodinium necroappetens]